MSRTMGDVQDPALRRIRKNWEHIGRSPWIVKPEWQVPDIAGGEIASQLIEKHGLPRLWQLLADYSTLLQRLTLRVQPPGWLQAPLTSEPEDLVSEDPVPLSNGTPTVVLTYTVPDRAVASFTRFGHDLTHAAEFGTVLWTIRVNEKPIRTYQNFKQQRGTILEPTPMAKPITLKSGDVLEVIAVGGVNAVSAIVRIPGWLIMATSVTQDGSGIDWNVR